MSDGFLKGRSDAFIRDFPPNSFIVIENKPGRFKNFQGVSDVRVNRVERSGVGFGETLTGLRHRAHRYLA